MEHSSPFSQVGFERVFRNSLFLDPSRTPDGADRPGLPWATIGLTVVALFVTVPVWADVLDTQEKALKLIADTGDRICYVIVLKGNSHSAEVTGDIKLELTGLVSKLASAGVSGSGKFSDNSFQSMLQKDLAPSVHDSAQCKLKVFEDLQAKLVQPVSEEHAK